MTGRRKPRLRGIAAPVLPGEPLFIRFCRAFTENLALLLRAKEKIRADLDAGEEVVEGAADDGVQAMLEPVEGQGADDLDGPDVFFDVDDAAAQEAVVKGGGGHTQAEAVQGCLPPLFH